MKTFLASASLLVILSAAGCSAPGDKDPGKEIPLPKQAAPAPPVVAMPITPALRSAAYEELQLAAVSSNPTLRANVIEAAKDSLDLPRAAPIILKGLSDPSPQVRFAACMAAGELRLADALEPAMHLHIDAEPMVRVGSIFCLHRLGNRKFSHEFEQYAEDGDAAIRGDVAMALGLLGEPSAIRILRVLAKDLLSTVRLQAHEALWRLGDQQGLESLVADTLSEYPDDEKIGVLGLAATKDQRVIEHIRGMLTSDYKDVGLAAARAMGMLGSDEGYAIAQAGAESQDPRQRFLAAMAFGAIGRSDAQTILTKLLADESQTVRVGAAMGILSLKNT